MDTADEPDDLHFCLRRILRLLSETCFSCLVKRPFAASSSLFLIVFWVSFPMAFWVLINAIPFLVCISLIVVTAFFKSRKEQDTNWRKSSDAGKTINMSAAGVDNARTDDNAAVRRIKKTVTRVHSVRRRRAMEFANNSESLAGVEEKDTTAAAAELAGDNIASKLSEESPKEIREVEEDRSHDVAGEKESTAATSPPKEAAYRIKTLEALKLVKDAAAAGKPEEEQKNDVVVDVGDEGNKRLENLIARRRSRNLWSINVRRALLKMEKRESPGGGIASIIIPKHNSSLHGPDPFSPGPGSAPSVLVPMRNPFDIPYDPQEEKPDLSGDGFQQEFLPAGGKADPVYCRHESFSLGSFSPAGFDPEPSDGDGGFGRRDSLQRYRFSKLGNEFEVSITGEEEASHDDDLMSKTTSLTKEGDEDTDDIKEIIHKADDDSTDADDVRAPPDTNPEEPGSDSSSPTSSSSSGDDEDDQIYKIDKEAILKSLSSMARRHVVGEFDNANSYDDDSYTYIDSHYEDKTVPPRHAHSFSIASDMQVELSEASSSPPHGIEDGFASHDGDIVLTPYDAHANADNKKIGQEWSENPSSPDDNTLTAAKSEYPTTLSNGGSDQPSDSMSISSETLQDNQQKS
ncbi:uncharacterized protein LOC127259464 [Andrographis paniculata]|uniref:uncharacterized protein LOC127259464 n=1 Tax=Andrographis paniculata TaxID=175694 RepID=UPI0021E88309|nr:uncharacterized protein LOC127259464 [Andrographis paniculata]